MYIDNGLHSPSTRSVYSDGVHTCNMLSWPQIASRLGCCFKPLSPAFSPSHFIGLVEINHKSSLVLVSFALVCSNFCTPWTLPLTHIQFIPTHGRHACSWIIYIALVTSTFQIMREENVSSVGVIIRQKSRQAGGQEGGKMPHIKNNALLLNDWGNITRAFQSNHLPSEILLSG